MIYLLGGSGYVGQAYQTLLTQKGIPFRNLRRAEVDYTNGAVLTAALKQDKPEFLINSAGYTGKPNVDACEATREETLFAKYRNVGGGVMWPMSIRRQRNGEKLYEIYSESVQINKVLKDDLFTLPASLKLLPAPK